MWQAHQSQSGAKCKVSSRLPGSQTSDLSGSLHFLLDTANDCQTTAFIIIVISVFSQSLITSKLILPISSGECRVMIQGSEANSFLSDVKYM